MRLNDSVCLLIATRTIYIHVGSAASSACQLCLYIRSGAHEKKK